MNNLNHQTSQAIRTQSEALAEAIVARQYRLQPEAWQAYDESGRKKSLRDAGYHLAYLSEAIAGGAPALFATTAWALTWPTPPNCSERFNACTERPNFPAPASAWPPSSASFTVTAGGCGRRPR